VTAFLTLLTIILSYLYGIKPYLESIRLKEAREFYEKYYLIKLKYVRKAYPDLQELSYKEISERYDVTEAYHRVKLKRSYE